MAAGLIRPVNINEEMREAYLDYAMSVIVARALPDARDGFKPVHRRILYAMHDMGLRADSSHKKSARIVGEVLGKYHPHGDASVYEAMARLAQDFSMRYPLVDGQGNFGSIDGDSPAAMRYTEARLSRLGAALLNDIDQDTVPFVDNFDGSLTEPDVLPCALPNLLVNGASGIAVGMSTNIPPHHMGEVCSALIYMLKEWDRLDEIDTADLLRFIKGPDFPTGGILYRRDVQSGEDTLLSTYASGRGKFTVRARAHIEQLGRGKSRIVVSEIPYQVNKNSLIERMADLVRDGRLEGISDLRDESDRQGLRIVVEIKSGTDPSEVLNALYKLTSLEESFNVIMLALVDGEPRTLSLKQALRVYLDHRLVVIRRRSQFELDRARERAHILQGLLTALNNLNLVISLIRESKDSDTAKAALIERLSLSDAQAIAILDMPLRRLAALERYKVEQEYAEKMTRIAELEKLLGDPVALRAQVGSELIATQEQFNDLRRTSIVDRPPSAVSADDLTQAEPTWITLTGDGKLSRTPTDAPPNVKLARNAAESPRVCLPGDASDIVYLITPDGMAATIPAQQLPPTDQPAEGSHYPILLPLNESVRPISALNVPPFLSDGYWLFVTANGEVKRIRIGDLPGLSANAFQVMNVGDDRIIATYSVDEEDEVILVSAQAQAIRFKVADVRPTGLPAGGMRGIKLDVDDGDTIIGGGIARPGTFLWAISGAGIAKYTPITEYPTQGRGGSGVIAMKLTNVLQPDGLFQTNNKDRLATALIGKPSDTLILLTAKGKRKVIAFKAALLAPRAKPGLDIAASLTNGGADRIIAVTHLVPRPEPAPSEQ